VGSSDLHPKLRKSTERTPLEFRVRKQLLDAGDLTDWGLREMTEGRDIGPSEVTPPEHYEILSRTVGALHEIVMEIAEDVDELFRRFGP